MKKISAVLLVLMLSSCWSGGRLDLFEGRNQWIEKLQSQPVDWFADEGQRMVKSENVTEKGFKTNEVLTAYKGQTVVDAKTYRKEYYAQEYLRANKSGTLNSGSVPITLKRNEKRRILGSTMRGSELVYLVQADLDEYVILVRDNGTFYPNLGRIVNERLVVMDETFIPHPSDLRFEPIVTMKVSQDRPVKGFDLKFGGMKLGQMLFTYFDYSDSAANSGNFQDLSVAKTETSIVKVKGVKLKILHADEQRIDYMILD